MFNIKLCWNPLLKHWLMHLGHKQLLQGRKFKAIMCPSWWKDVDLVETLRDIEKALPKTRYCFTVYVKPQKFCLWETANPLPNCISLKHAIFLLFHWLHVLYFAYVFINPHLMGPTFNLCHDCLAVQMAYSIFLSHTGTNWLCPITHSPGSEGMKWGNDPSRSSLSSPSLFFFKWHRDIWLIYSHREGSGVRLDGCYSIERPDQG